MQYQPILFLF